MQFFKTKFFYKDIGDNLKINFLVTRKIERGKKMTTNFNTVDALQRPSLLFGSKKERKAVRKNLEQQFMSEYLAKGMNEKQAKRFAKAKVENYAAEERVARTVTYYDKEAGKEAKKLVKKEDMPFFVEILSKRDKKVIDRNAEDFKNNGELSLNKSKEFIHGWTGDDLTLNDGSNLERPEDHVLANYLGTSDRRARHIAKKFGFEAPSLALKRAAHVATGGLLGGAFGGGAAKSGDTTATFFSNAVVDHNGNILKDPILDIVKIHGDVAGALTAGAVLGALGGIGTINAVGGDKDLFNGREPKAIIESRNIKGLDKSIQPLMTAIIADEVMTDDQKVQLITEAIGKNSSSLCNEREFVALYDKILNQKPQGNQPPQGNTQPPQGNTQPPQGNTQPPQGNTQPPQETCPIEDYEKDVKEEKDVEMKSYDYRPKRGEYWYGIVAAKYGLKDPVEIKAAVKELKQLHGLTDAQRKQNIQPKVMHLPETLHGHKYLGNKVTERTNKFPKAKPYNGKYTNPTTKQQVETRKYGFEDCEYTSPLYNDEATRNAEKEKYAQSRK